jgi:hypothetical protein
MVFLFFIENNVVSFERRVALANKRVIRGKIRDICANIRVCPNHYSHEVSPSI